MLDVALAVAVPEGCPRHSEVRARGPLDFIEKMPNTRSTRTPGPNTQSFEGVEFRLLIALQTLFRCFLVVGARGLACPAYMQ
jgi:hypothetical protein